MLCTGSGCDRMHSCGRYYISPQPEERKYDTLENLYQFGGGSISLGGASDYWVCGEHGNWGMYEPLPKLRSKNGFGE